jgi:hypothetical protein
MKKQTNFLLPVIVSLCLWVPTAQASDYGDGYIFQMILGMFGIPIVAGLAGFVLISKGAQTDTNERDYLKLFFGVCLLLYCIVNLIFR